MADGGEATECEVLYGEGAFSQVAYRDGVWWHWRRPCAILGAWVPVTGARSTPWPRPTHPVVEAASERAARGPHPVATMPAGAP